MKKLCYLLGLSLFALVTGCHSSDLPIPGASEESVSHTISVEDALKNLKSFMKEGNTRAADIPEVSDVLTVKYKTAATRAGGSVVDCENLIYVANFEDEQGYAILAADDRIDEPVLAIVDQGHLNDENVDDAVSGITSPSRPFFEGYPATGPGIFTVPETGDQLYMNPNTVDLYDADKDDTLVGNFIPDNSQRPGNYGSENDDDKVIEDDNEPFPTTLCVVYALNSVNSNRYRKSMPKEPVDTIDRDMDSIRTDFEGERTERYETISSEWYVTEQVAPILSQYIFWRQKSPFNDFYPEVRQYWLLGAKRTAFAGCFPLALAKIIAHHERPYNISYNGINVDWTELKRNANPDEMSITAKKSAAALLRSIDLGCDSWHFYEGTFTFPGDAREFFSLWGYTNVKEYSYSWELSKQMLLAGKPFCIYAMPGNHITQSHCWNLDGYKIKEQKITYNHYVNNILEGTSVSYYKEKMVHCDFGWSRKCNGYYVSGIFDQSGNQWEPDYPYLGRENYNYNNYLHIMTYDL